MNSYNKLIASDILRRNENFIHHTPQPETLSTGMLIGGKRVRAHPQVGNTAYSRENASLVPHGNNLMLDHLDGAGWFDDITSGLKNVGSEVFKDVILPVGKEVGRDALKSYLKGNGRRGRPKKQVNQGAGIGEDILEGVKTLAPFAPLLMGLGREEENKMGGKRRGRPKKGGDFFGDIADIGKSVVKDVGKDLLRDYIRGKGRPKKGGSAELYPPAVAKGGKRAPNKRAEIVKKVMKQHGLNLPQASKYVKEHNLY